MPDFTLNTFDKLLTSLKEKGHTFQTFAGFLKDPAPRVIILRHDVDARKMNSLKTAQLENELGITGTYYFRMVPASFDENLIKKIAALGHEIGYHYEDLSKLAALRRASCVVNRKNRLKTHDSRLKEEELLKVAIESFRENLAKLRRVVPVETICMHGSPLSRWDNRLLWKYYDYREFGIIGEPYFDLNFDKLLYLTDTGRRWDGEGVSVRDKVQNSGQIAGSGEQGAKHLKPHAANRTPVLRFHSTFDIIKAAQNGELPDQIMLTTHPQRWDNRPFPWIRELVWQNIKNIGKKLLQAH